MSALFRRLRARWLRRRLDVARAQLAWTLQQVPECLHRQRAHIAALDREVHRIAPDVPRRDTDTIRRDIERQAKLGVLL